MPDTAQDTMHPAMAALRAIGRTYGCSDDLRAWVETWMVGYHNRQALAEEEIAMHPDIVEWTKGLMQRELGDTAAKTGMVIDESSSRDQRILTGRLWVLRPISKDLRDAE